MPSIKETFDKNRYDEMIKSTNYVGAFNYLNDLSNNTDDYSEKDALQPFISNLRQKIHRDESMLRYAIRPGQAKQYYFYDAIKTGAHIEKGTNNYYDEYTDALASIGNYDKKGNKIGEANQLEFSFKSENTYKQFLDKIGITDSQFQQLSVLVGSNNGRKTFSINKSNPLYYDIIQNVFDTQRDVMNQVPSGGYGPAADNLLMLYRYGLADNRNGIAYRSYDRKGNLIKDYDTLYDGVFNAAMSKINSLIESAKNNYENLEALATQDLIVSSFSLPWKTAAHARAEELLTTTGDTEEYNKTIQRLDGQLTGGLMALNLSQENVWATGEQDDPNYHQLTPEEKIAYQQILRDAIREGRIGTTDNKLGGVHMAMLGDKFGYQIDILPKNEKGLFSGFGEDNSNIHRTIFIENPWPQEKMTQAFESRTEFQAMKELILMDQYKYPYDLIDGGVLELTSPLGGVYKHPNGVIEEVNRDKALKLLNENFIKERGIRGIQQKYNTNKSSREYEYSTFEDAIDSNAWSYALQAAKELVPEEDKKSYLDKAYDLYNSILNGANYKGKRAVTIKEE